MTFTIILIVFILFLGLWNISLVISVIYGAPTVYAKRHYIKKAFELARITPGQIVLDLGCGNARSLIIAAKEFKAKGIGVEISPFYYLLANFNVLIKGESKNIKIYYGNILNQKKLIKKADIVYLYLFDKLLSKLENDIFTNIKPSGKVISIAFPLKNHKPYIENESPRVFVYKKN